MFLQVGYIIACVFLSMHIGMNMCICAYVYMCKHYISYLSGMAVRTRGTLRPLLRGCGGMEKPGGHTCTLAAICDLHSPQQFWFRLSLCKWSYSGMNTSSHLISYKNSKKVSASVSASHMSNTSQVRVPAELFLTPTVMLSREPGACSVVFALSLCL